MFKNADAISIFSFLTIIGGVIALVLFAIARSSKASKNVHFIVIKSLFLLLCWLGILNAVVTSGLIEAKPWPRAMIFFGVSILAGVLFAFSSLGRRIGAALPLSYLVGFQGFRLPLELVLHSWVKQGVVPETMTWTGSNYDVLSGTLALLAAPLATKYRKMAWLMNCVGFLLLLNVMRVAVLSSPLPFSWQIHPPLQLAFHSPYFLIIPICVAGALAGHIILTRRLLAT